MEGIHVCYSSYILLLLGFGSFGQDNLVSFEDFLHFPGLWQGFHLILFIPLVYIFHTEPTFFAGGVFFFLFGYH